MIAFNKLPRIQTEALRLAAEGMSNVEIADKLQVCESTVQTHLKHLSDLWHARNRAHCVHLGYQYGVLTVAPSVEQPVQIGAEKRPSSKLPRQTPAERPKTAAPPLFMKVGGVHRAVAPKSAPGPTVRPLPAAVPSRPEISLPPPTHEVRVEHPTYSGRSWQVELVAANDAAAERRVRQLAGWLAPPFRVSAIRIGKQVPVLTVDAFGRAVSMAGWITGHAARTGGKL